MSCRVRNAIAVLLLVSAAGCGIQAQDDARRIDDDEVPAGLLEGATTAPPETTDAPPSSAPALQSTIYLVDGDRLVAVDRSVPTRGAADLIDSLLEGPTDEEATDGIRSALESADVVSSVDQRGRQMAIDLTPAFTETPPTEQRLALAQLTFTATEDPVVRDVVFTLDGEAISVPRADGTTSDGPVRRLDYRSLAP